MYMRVPFKVTAKSLQDADESRGKLFRFVYHMEHGEAHAPHGGKRAPQKFAVFQEKVAQLFRDGEYAVAVAAVYQPEGHGSGTVNGIHVHTGWAELAVTAERHDFMMP